MARKRKKKMKEDEKVDQPPMTPMIDVVFQLLIYFMLTMHFKEVEGKLLSQLPKDKGLASSPVNQPELQEVRIFLCAGGDIKTHRYNKGKHEKGDDKPNEICYSFVEKNEIGEMYKTEVHGKKFAHNRAIYKAIAEKTAELGQVTPSYWDETKKAPIILDADSEIPYEHIIGVVNACKEVGIDNIEFVGNARFGEFYGSGDRSQFKRHD